MMGAILLNPGPVNLSERVRQALLRPDLCHREPEFSELQQSIRARLLDVYHLDEHNWTAVLLTGSGTAAMEAMLTSLAPRDGEVLIIENGVYGERLTRIARTYAIPHRVLHYPWGAELHPRDIATHCTDRTTHVALIHHETTSGRLNDLAAIAGFCRERNLRLLVDGVSSFGAEELRFQEWDLDACAATANKCLHGVPGVSFVLLRRSLLADAAVHQPRSVYLDLHTYFTQQETGGTPFTQSVQCCYALLEALAEHREQGGWESRGKQYRVKLDRVRAGLRELGIEPLLPPADCSCVLASFHLPPGLDYPALHDGLKQRGFVIYAGQGDLARTMFRVSVMGTCTLEDMDRFVAVLRDTLEASRC